MRSLAFFLLIIILQSCAIEPSGSMVTVTNSQELEDAISQASPGDEIIMSNGIWKDIEIRFIGEGKEGAPITLRAETAGEVFIEGESDLKLAGEYLVVSGLHFRNGYSPSSAVIEFGIDSENLAFNSTVSECVVIGFNKPQRDNTDLWVRFKGRHNQLDRSYLSGKSNRGPTIRVDLEGNQSINNYHKITNNHFGPRPPKGGPSAETIQIGNSSTSVSPSYTFVANNFFDRCNGEVEVISSKSNFNEFRNNIFYKSEGSLVTRHGNYCTIDGNFFIGEEGNDYIGGIRLIGTGHWVTNNYFYNLSGKEFRGPLAVMNGIPRSPLNRYIQVTDVVVAHNSWINCTSPWQIGVGSNISQKDVLPASEIRSATPIRTIIANNVLHNDKGDSRPIYDYDSMDGIQFESNLVNNQGVDFNHSDKFIVGDLKLEEKIAELMAPTANSGIDLYFGFEFDKISNDLFGNKRGDNNDVGAVLGVPQNLSTLVDPGKYGPGWFDPEANNSGSRTVEVTTTNELIESLSTVQEGDQIVLSSGEFKLSESISVSTKLSIRSAEQGGATLTYTGEGTLFEMNPGGNLTLDGVKLQGSNGGMAFAPLEKNMSSPYQLHVKNSEISDFGQVLKAYKESFATSISFENTQIHDCDSGIELAAETNDRGDYNSEIVKIVNSSFRNVASNVINYYRGGYDESTVGGTLLVSGSEFEQCGGAERSRVLLNTYGIINVELSDNTFKNNPVQHVAVLWGAKNNSESNNTLSNSGKIIVEENLKLRLMY